MKLSEAAKILGIKFQGPDVEFTSVSTDTRTLQPGALFVALQGESSDGHQFIAQAKQAGAIAALVNKNNKVTEDISLLPVENPQQAFCQLATNYREKLAAKIIAVTGSCGKTTTRSLLENVMREAGKTQASEKSFNNEIGVPLTLLKVTDDCEYVVSEIGANHHGEIAKLTQIVKPNVAIITNAAPAHLAGFGDLTGVSRAKGEIFQGLSAEGVAIINNDDQFAEYWKSLNSQRRVITFGINNKADVYATTIKMNKNVQASFQLHTPQGEINIQMQLIGEHNVRNALAAAAAGYALNIPLIKIKKGLESDCAVYRRLIVKKGYRDCTIIDDSYNANPLSVTAAIQVLAQRTDKSILVLGDMLELGDGSADLHRRLGETAKQLGIAELYCYGNFTRHTAEAFGKTAHHYTSQDELIDAVKERLNSQVTVLVKGSLSMKMDKVVAALTM